MTEAGNPAENESRLLRGSSDVWRVFISYRRSEVTTQVALWLKEELERDTLEASTGQIFRMEVFVDAAQPHQVDFQAHLQPRLQHSRALLVIADESAAVRKDSKAVDFLYEELDWWARNRKRAPPIILQLEKQTGTKLVADSKFEHWRKVNFLDCFWEKWNHDPQMGLPARKLLLAKVRESVRAFGQIVHLEEVRRLKRRAWIAAVFAVSALISAGLAVKQAKEATAQRNHALEQTSLAQRESTAASLGAAQFAVGAGDLSSARNWLDRIQPQNRGWEWYYLRSAADGAELTLRQTDEFLGARATWSKFDDRSFKEDKIRALTYSSDGRLIAAGTEHGTLFIWDALSGKPVKEQRLPAFVPVNALAFDSANSHIAVGCSDGEIIIYDLTSGNAVTLPEQRGVVSALMYSADGALISAGWDGRIIGWDIKTRTPKFTIDLPGASDNVRALESGSHDLSGSEFEQILRLPKRPRTEDRFFKLRPLATSVISAILSRNGPFLFAELDQGSIIRVNLQSGNVAEILHSNSVLLAGPRPFMLTFRATKQHDGSRHNIPLTISDLDDPHLKWNVERIGANEWPISVTPDLHQVVATSGSLISVYELRNLSKRARLVGHDLEVSTIAFSPDASRMASGSADGHVKVWNLYRKRDPSELQFHKGPVKSICFAIVGGVESIITASEDGRVAARSLPFMNGNKELFRQSKPISSLAISSDHRKLIIVSELNDAALIDLQHEGSPPRFFKGLRGTAVAFNRDATRIFVGYNTLTANRRFKLVDLSTGETIGPPQKLFEDTELSSVSSVLLRPRHEEFVWIAFDRMVEGDIGIRDAFTGSRKNILETGENFRSLAIAPDDRLVAAGTSSGPINLFDVSSPDPPGLETMVSLYGHLGDVLCLTFTPDGRRAISGSNDGTVRVWDVAGRRELLTLRVGAAVTAIALTPDGKTLTAGDVAGKVHIWSAAQ